MGGCSNGSAEGGTVTVGLNSGFFCVDGELQFCYVFFGVVSEAGVDPCDFHGIAAAFQIECVHMGKELFVIYG